MKSDWRDVEMPRRIAALQKDERGLPIPFIVWRDTDGKPHFTINDGRKQVMAVISDLCSICGAGLARERWYVGGPLSAFHKAGYYIDGAMHQDCCEYALKVCPYLAAPNYSGRLDDRLVDDDKKGGGLFVDPAVIPERPSVFVAVKTRGATFQQRGPEQVFIKPDHPYLEVKFWRHGQQLSAEEGATLVDETMRQHKVSRTMRRLPA
jgi:hypothetical protein